MKSKIKINSIKLNVFLNILYTTMNVAFPLITYPYVSRVLAADGIGKVNFFSSIGSYAIMLAGIGIPTYGIRIIAKSRKNISRLREVFLELFNLNVFSTIGITIVYTLSILFIKQFQQNLPLFIANGIWIILAPLSVDWFYSGLEQYAYITKRTIAFKLLSLCLIFLFVRSKSDFIYYAVIIIVANLGSYICNFYYAIRILGRETFRLRKTQLKYKKHIKPAFTLFASTLAVSVYLNLDTIMLGFIRGDRQVGLYTTAVKIEMILLTAVNAISSALLPRLSYYISQKRLREFNTILKKSISLIFVITVSISIFLIISARQCILLIAGSDYVDATLSMQLLMPILIISGISNITGNQILIPNGKDTLYLKAVSMGAAVDFFLNLILMKKFGCTGASISTLFAELTQTCIQLNYSKHELRGNVQFNELCKTGIAGILAGTITMAIRELIASLELPIIQLIILGIAFFWSYILMLVVMKERYIKDLLRNILGRF